MFAQKIIDQVIAAEDDGRENLELDHEFDKTMYRQTGEWVLNAYATMDSQKGSARAAIKSSL